MDVHRGRNVIDTFRPSNQLSATLFAMTPPFDIADIAPPRAPFLSWFLTFPPGIEPRGFYSIEDAAKGVFVSKILLEGRI